MFREISFHSTLAAAVRQSALLAAGVWALACAPAAPDDRVLTGLDVLVRDSMAPLRGLRVGLITNHTGVATVGDSTVSGIDLLHASPNIELVKLFGPEHSISGRVNAGEAVGDERDPGTGLPVYSLYGETRRPTPEMLAGLDALLFDIQDVGSRYYTYAWTMALALQAAAQAGLTFVVLDRPNPIGGELVQGDVLDTAFASFVGLHAVPMRHGLTVGELAGLLNGELGWGARLTVIPVENWHRNQWYDDTGLSWVPPSPNMPSLESATHYPGTCLFEGTNLSVGRGTEAAFQQIGATWLDSDALVGRLQAQHIPGVRFEALRFTPHQPGDDKFPEQEVRGVRFVTTDRAAYDPARTAIAALVEIRALHPDSLRFQAAHFDRLAGTDQVRQQLLAGRSAAEITAPWAAQLQRFDAIRRKYLLYD